MQLFRQLWFLLMLLAEQKDRLSLLFSSENIAMNRISFMLWEKNYQIRKKKKKPLVL